MWSVLGMRQRLNGAPTKVNDHGIRLLFIHQTSDLALGAFPAKPHHRDTTNERAGIPGTTIFITWLQYMYLPRG